MQDIRILLVEEEKKIAESLRKGLSEHSYKVDTAYDGNAGRKMFESHHFDLVMLDINVPGMSGYDLCKKIRNRNPLVPVVMLTALSTTDDKIEGFDAGADDYIVKPFDFQELLVRIRALLKRIHLSPPDAGNVLRVADLVMNLDSRKCSAEEMASR